MTNTQNSRPHSAPHQRTGGQRGAGGEIPPALFSPETALELLERHAAKISFNKFGCWNWTAATAGGLNYGNLWCHKEGRMVRAHRAFYEAFYGAIPDGLILCHVCDNPKCCNPRHMFVGTYQDNMQDMVAKGRYKLKTNHYRSTNIRSSKSGFKVEIQRNGKRQRASFKNFCEAVLFRSEFLRNYQNGLKTPATRAIVDSSLLDSPGASASGAFSKN